MPPCSCPAQISIHGNLYLFHCSLHLPSIAIVNYPLECVRKLFGSVCGLQEGFRVGGLV